MMVTATNTKQWFGKFEESDFSKSRNLVAPSRWIPALCGSGANLLDGLRSESVKTLDALLVKLCGGDVVAKEMLRHLLIWLPHSIRPDGAIWRTAAQWEAETGLTDSQVRYDERVKRLKNIGVKIWVEMAQGSPTRHYKINARAFTLAIARVLGFDLLTAKFKLWVNKIAGDSGKTDTHSGITGGHPLESADHLPESANPLTDSTTILTTETNNSESVDKNFSPSYKLLKETKLLSENECVRFSNSLTVEKIQACIDSLETAEIKKSRRAYFRAALTKQVEAQDVAARQGINSDWADYVVEDAPPPSPLPKVETVAETETAGGGYSCWQVACDQLESQLDKSNFVYIEQMKLISQDETEFVFEVPHQIIDKLNRLYRNIRRALADVLLVRHDAVEIRFEVVKG